MSKAVRHLVFLLVTLLAGPAFGVPKSALDAYIGSLKSRIVEPQKIIVTPYVSLYKKGDRTEPIATFFLFSWTRDSTGAWDWSHDFYYISDSKEQFDINYVKFTSIRKYGGAEDDDPYLKWGRDCSGTYTIASAEVFGKFPIANIRFGHMLYIEEGAHGEIHVPVTDRYDAVCLEGASCPWITPTVVDPPKVKVEESKVTDPLPPPVLLTEKKKPNPKEFVGDPVWKVNQKKLDLLERQKKLRNLFRKLPNEPITNWYFWVQENLEGKPVPSPSSGES